MRNFDKDLPQPATPFARLPAQALPSTLMIPWTHPGPGGQMLGTGKAAHIGPDLGNEDLCRPLANTRDGVQEGNRFLLRREALVDFCTDALNGLVQILQRA